MTAQHINHTTTRRRIGPWGTAARLVVGGYLAGSVVYGSFTGAGTFDPLSWLLGLVILPAALLGWQAWRAGRHPHRLVAFTGPLGHLATAAVFLILYGTTWYAPPIDFVSDAALLFFGASMLLAAYRGYAGCEVLSISNWLLRRDDQLGCMLFDPIDRLERARPGTRPEGKPLGKPPVPRASRSGERRAHRRR